ncbi:unnamed protein product [Brassica napus]|uniref:(rape) hypothetical protein n=1 Tax=Brassica napus TaxID=3708 RepID=A0A816NW89_BRANA|nr:unnamed protein product [Brassica napus]
MEWQVEDSPQDFRVHSYCLHICKIFVNMIYQCVSLVFLIYEAQINITNGLR